MSSLVEVRRSGPVTTLTLNRPQRHNSLVPELLEELLAALYGVDEGAIVLEAAGRSFSTGGDVRGFFEAQDLERYAHQTVGLLNEVMLAMIRLGSPIIAAVHGIVTGGSLGLLLASDVVLVTPEVTITPWYAPVGYSPDGGWTALLPGIIGPKRTAALLLNNGSISAENAVAWGLAAELVPPDELSTRAHALATEIVAMKQGSLASIKRLLRPDDIAAALERERAAFVTQILTPEAMAGMRSFLGEER